MDVDPRLAGALREQLARRSEVLAGGARHVGWKLGMGERERIGGSIAVGVAAGDEIAGEVTGLGREPQARTVTGTRWTALLA